jgi:hypothetical protein
VSAEDGQSPEIDAIRARSEAGSAGWDDPVSDARFLLERLGEVESERDMYREKAHRFIASVGRWDVRYGALWTEHQSLVDALSDLAAKAETLAVMVVPASALRVFSEPHYRDDGPNGETTACHCGIGSDHTLEAMRDLYDGDGERVIRPGVDS